MGSERMCEKVKKRKQDKNPKVEESEIMEWNDPTDWGRWTGEELGKSGRRLIGQRQKSEMDREGRLRLEMSARCLFTPDQSNGLFPLHQSH